MNPNEIADRLQAERDDGNSRDNYNPWVLMHRDVIEECIEAIRAADEKATREPGTYSIKEIERWSRYLGWDSVANDVNHPGVGIAAWKSAALEKEKA